MRVLFSHVDNRESASRLARTRSTLWYNSFWRIWGEPLKVPHHFPRPNIDGVSAQLPSLLESLQLTFPFQTIDVNVRDAFLERSVYVKSVRLSLRNLQRSPRSTAFLYPQYPFPNLRHLDVWCSWKDTLIDRFLPPTIERIDLTLSPRPDFTPDITALISSAPRLVRLVEFQLDHCLPDDDQGLSVPGIMEFLHNLPYPQQLVSFCYCSCLSPHDLVPFISALPNLTSLALDLRFPCPPHNIVMAPPLDVSIDTMSATEVAQLHLLPSRLHVFDMQSLVRRFKALVDLTLLIDGVVDPINFVHLRHLSRLEKVDIQVPNLGVLLTMHVFEELVRAWTRVTHLLLLDSRRHDRSWTTTLSLQIEALGSLDVHCPCLQFLSLAVNTTFNDSLPTTRRTLRNIVRTEVHWTGQGEDDLRTLSYLEAVCGGVGMIDESPYGQCCVFQL